MKGIKLQTTVLLALTGLGLLTLAAKANYILNGDFESVVGADGDSTTFEHWSENTGLAAITETGTNRIAGTISAEVNYDTSAREQLSQSLTNTPTYWQLSFHFALFQGASNRNFNAYLEHSTGDGRINFRVNLSNELEVYDLNTLNWQPVLDAGGGAMSPDLSTDVDSNGTFGNTDNRLINDIVFTGDYGTLSPWYTIELNGIESQSLSYWQTAAPVDTGLDNLVFHVENGSYSYLIDNVVLAPPIPEPGSLLLLAVGMTFLIRRRS